MEERLIYAFVRLPNDKDYFWSGSFGICCQSLQQTGDAFPLAKPHIFDSFYVDDCLAGTDNVEQAFLLQQQLQGLLEKGEFSLQKWRTNSTDVLDSIPQELKESTAVKPILQEDGHHKTLGIDWNSDNDVFHVSISQEAAPLISAKRGLVSDIARTYDVLGWFTPSIVVMKILLQPLWDANLDWDEEVTHDIQFKHLRGGNRYHYSGLRLFQDITLLIHMQLT